MLTHEKLAHVPRVVHTAVQLLALARVVDADLQGQGTQVNHSNAAGKVMYVGLTQSAFLRPVHLDGTGRARERE